VVIVVSAGLGVVIGGLSLWLAKKGRDARIPFGPYLAVGGLVALVWGRAAVVAWVGYFPA
jgi:leader peptidase (prepilin peptidase)/N-methyltransferase